jgi:hypothetical protein
MTLEAHLQQMIGSMAFQLAQKDVQLEAQAAEIERLKQFEPKPKKPRKKVEATS